MIASATQIRLLSLRTFKYYPERFSSFLSSFRAVRSPFSRIQLSRVYYSTMEDPTKNLLTNAQSIISSLEQRVKELEEQLHTVAIADDKDDARKLVGREKTRLTKSTGRDISDAEGRIGGPFTIGENPSFLEPRLAVFERLYEKQQKIIAEKPREAIKITLPDGTVKVLFVVS